jgi:hypothetical protein
MRSDDDDCDDDSDSVAGDDALRYQLNAVLRRLHRELPPRMGPLAAEQMLSSLSRAAESGTSVTALLASATQVDKAMLARPRITAPWPGALCRAIATVAPKKLAHGTFLLRRPLQLPDPVVAGVAAHADALVPAFGDVDFALGVAWQNVLTFHTALVVGECFDRNDASPVFDLADAFADVNANSSSVVPVAVWRGRGVLVACGHQPPREDRHFAVAALQLIEWGKHHDMVDVGDVAGVVSVLRALKVRLGVATLPAIVTIAALMDPDADVVDVDGVMGGLGAAEADLEATRQRGQTAHARLGQPSRTPPPLQRLRLRVGERLVRIENDDDGTMAVVVN